MLKCVAAGRPLGEVPDAEVAAALRDFERRRSARCGALIAQARATGKRNIFRKSWLVRAWLQAVLCSCGDALHCWPPCTYPVLATLN